MIDDYYQRLLTYPGLTALIGDRVYAVTADDEATAPYCVYEQVSGGKRYTHGGYAGLQRPRMQVTCYASTYEVAKDISVQVTAAMESWPAASVLVGSAFQQNEIDLYDNDTGLYIVPVDFFITYYG